MKHKGTQEIRTQRLLLRQFTPDDAEVMYRNWASDERVTKFLTWPAHTSPELTRRLLEEWCKEYTDPTHYQWVIELEGECIGSISVVHQSEQSMTAEIGYCIGYDYWGKGVMSEAVSAVIDYFFGVVGFNRISLSHAVKNPASGRVAQKCGMTLEGTQREVYRNMAGEFLDLNIYSILRREWAARQNEKEERSHA